MEFEVFEFMLDLGLVTPTATFQARLVASFSSQSVVLHGGGLGCDPTWRTTWDTAVALRLEPAISIKTKVTVKRSMKMMKGWTNNDKQTSNRAPKSML